MNIEILKLSKHFSTGEIGSVIRYFGTIDSTNRMALGFPDSEAKHGTVLVAGSQTAGRGRQGREWLSLPGLGLYFTAILKPENPGDIAPLLGLAAALSVYDTLDEFCRSPLDIKWPNDVLLDGKKVSGILGETSSRGTEIRCIALGMSVNVKHRPDDFPEDLRNTATSILVSEGKAPELADLLLSLLRNLNRRYRDLVFEDSSSIPQEIAKRSSYVRGKRLKVELKPCEIVAGTSAGLNEDGTLQLRLDSGVEIAIQAGDVHLIEN